MKESNTPRLWNDGEAHVPVKQFDRQISALRGSRMLSAFVAVLLVASGCKHSEKAMTVPQDLQIMIGQEGGFAGRATGYTFEADGSVVEWEGKYPGENRRADAPADKQRAIDLWQKATEADVLNTSQQDIGNMTWFVAVRAGGETRRVSWARWPEDGEALTDAQQFYNTCLAAAKVALTK